MLSAHVQIAGDVQGYLSELLDIHTLDILMFGPCVQIAYERQGCFWNLIFVDTLDI